MEANVQFSSNNWSNNVVMNTSSCYLQSPEERTETSHDCEEAMNQSMMSGFQMNNSVAKSDRIDAKSPFKVPGKHSIKKRSGGGRDKERSIQDVIRKVAIWRKLYSGIVQPNGDLVRYGLEDAAKKVGISRKTLDDYLL